MDSSLLSTIDRDQDGFITLERTYSNLYKKSSFLTADAMVMNRIYEYDLHSANVSALRYSNKIDPARLDFLESLPKQDREVIVGKMIRADNRKHRNVADRQVSKLIAKGILSAREKLFRYNHIQDADVLSIKNDAVFIIGHKLDTTTFGPFTFRAKNVYSGYLNIEKTEIYYDKKHKTIHMKGVNDAILKTEDHSNGMILFFLQVFKYLDMDQRDDLRLYLIDFVHDYKSLVLPHQYYRELNGENIYRTNISAAGFEYNMTEANDSDIDIINPIYNYNKYILPVIRMFM